MSDPQISVICIVPDNLKTVRIILEHLERQTVADRIELVLVTPMRLDGVEAGLKTRGFAAVTIVETGPMLSTAHARAVGVRRAAAPLVAFVEDHCFPDPGWAEAFLQAHQGPWAAVGPMVANANPRSPVSRANFWIEYLDWAAPKKSGPVPHLPGHNSSYKKVVLLDYGDRLPEFLEAESVLHWDMGSRGHCLFLETAATARHMNFSRFVPAIRLRLLGSRLFAATRAGSWSISRRLVYITGGPLIPIVRMVRILKKLVKSGHRFQGIAQTLPAMTVFLLVEAVAEVIGYAFGPGHSSRCMVDLDFHRERFLNRHDRRLFSPSDS